jgi:tetratricopeptide (TPR) repeat protein
MDDLDLGLTLRGFAAGQKVFGRYALVRLLGRGGMGVVWLARDEELDQEVALKFLPEVVMGDNGAIDDMRRETRRARELTHPNIVRIHDFLRDSRMAAISMEYVAGDSLANRRLELPARVFEPAELAKWVEQLCAAQEYAHAAAKIVHRDLKPANLMVDARDELKIADFGISAALSDTTTRVSKQAGSSGTPVYMSPQQMMGEKPAATDDIYSLGATLYELLTGKPPFYSGNILLQVQNKMPPSVAERREELGVGKRSAEAGDRSQEPIPQAWEETIAACLAKDSARRPQSASEVWQRLNGISFTREAYVGTPSASEVRTTSAVESSAMPGKPRSRVPLWIAAAIGALALVGGWYFCLHVPEQKRRSEIARVEAQRLDAKARIAREQTAAEAARLEKARGGLVVRTVPDGAEVQIGAVALEKAPLKINELRLGKYPVRARLDGYDEWKGEAVVVEDVYSEISVRLTRSRGMLSVRSAQPGVRWKLASAPEGETTSPKEGLTPMTLTNLPTGTYVVEFAETLGVRTRETVKVRAGETTSIEHSIRTGSLALSSNLSFVTWKIQSVSPDILLTETLGGVPGSVAGLPAGKYAVTFYREGWPEIRKEIEVAGADTVNVSAEFDTGDLKIDSTPQGAEIVGNDGVLLGRTPSMLRDWHPGRVSLALRKDGFETKQLSGLVRSREALKLSAELKVHPAVALAVRLGALYSNAENDAAGKACDELLAMADVPAKEKSIALLIRGIVKRVAGNFNGAADDFTQIIDDERAPAVWKAWAFTQRGIAKANLDDKKGEQADHAAAIAKCTQLLDGKMSDVETRALALFTRAISKGGQGDAGGRIADYTTVIELAGAPISILVDALINRGHEFEERKDYVSAIKECQTVGELAGAPVNKMALALNNIGAFCTSLKDSSGAIAAYAGTIDLGPKISLDLRSKAYVERAAHKQRAGLVNDSIADTTAVIDMRDPAVSEVIRSKAYSLRGMGRRALGDVARALEDFAAANTAGASIESRVSALSSIAAIRLDQQDANAALAASNQAIEIGRNADCQTLAYSYYVRAKLNLGINRSNEAISDATMALNAERKLHHTSRYAFGSLLYPWHSQGERR